MSRITMRAITLAVGALVLLAVPHRAALATPFYMVESGSRCTTCHVEPLGWANPQQRRERRCTLDCSGCHLSPTGGGGRTPLGRYYGEEVLPMWGARPSSAADPERFLPEGYPSEGRYTIQGGFEGWWPGDVDFRTIDDRLGWIDPDPTWLVGADLRAMLVAPTDGDDAREVVAFPMEAQAYLAVMPIDHLSAYLDIGYQGSTADGINGSGSQREAIDMVWLRELHVKVDDLAYGTWFRLGRFTLPFGWRIPDHTAYIRRGTFDQYRQAYGAEAGVAANEWWINASVWRQGLDRWPGDSQPPGYGATAQGGIRRLGVQAGASAHVMRGLDGTSDEIMLGPLWGLNLAPIAYLGELDWRRTADGDGRPVDGINVFHEARLTAIRGLTPRARWEWYDPDVLTRDDQRARIVVGAEWNPVRYLQFDLAWRRELVRDRAGAHEILLQLHTWVL